MLSYTRKKHCAGSFSVTTAFNLFHEFNLEPFSSVAPPTREQISSKNSAQPWPRNVMMAPVPLHFVRLGQPALAERVPSVCTVSIMRWSSRAITRPRPSDGALTERPPSCFSNFILLHGQVRPSPWHIYAKRPGATRCRISVCHSGARHDELSQAAGPGGARLTD